MADFSRILKGFAIGSANVIPGVSGGTIAVITGIYERLIEALSKFDGTTVLLVLRFKWRAVWDRVDGRFLLALGIGVAASIVTMARIMDWGFENHPVLIWAFFFGLIAASIPSLGALVDRWSCGPFVGLLGGAAGGVAVAFLQPASGSDSVVYLLLCGAAAMCSMIIPGLSGSFVLLLMGAYRLVMIDAVNSLTKGELAGAMEILVPFFIGALVGVALLARLLSWLFRRAHDFIMALITGFVAGSLVLIWPWKSILTETFINDGVETEKISGFAGWFLPDLASGVTWASLGCMLAGAGLVLFAARVGGQPSGSRVA